MLADELRAASIAPLSGVTKEKSVCADNRVLVYHDMVTNGHVPADANAAMNGCVVADARTRTDRHMAHDPGVVADDRSGVDMDKRSYGRVCSHGCSPVDEGRGMNAGVRAFWNRKGLGYPRNREARPLDEDCSVQSEVPPVGTFRQHSGPAVGIPKHLDETRRHRHGQRTIQI